MFGEITARECNNERRLLSKGDNLTATAQQLDDS